MQVRIRRTESRDLVLTEEAGGRLSAVGPADEFERYAAENVLAVLDAVIRKVGLVGLLARVLRARGAPQLLAGDVADVLDVQLDRFKRVLPCARDELRVRLWVREQLLHPSLRFFPRRDEVRVTVLRQHVELRADALVLHFAGLVHCGFEDVHDKGGKTVTSESAVVREVVLHRLPIGYVLRAVLPVATVFLVSPLQNCLSSFRAIKNSAKAGV
jgi:hypothetical protein